MSEPPAGRKEPSNEAEAALATPPSEAPEVADALIPNTDNTPTVISQARPRPRPEDLFPLVLRGRTLAHFELIEPIGVGGMAAVIRARDTQLDRIVALKILPPEMAADPENIRRFHQEARAAAKLDHENIARVYLCGEDQGLHFIAFEFVEGEDVRTRLERQGRIPVPEAVHCVLQVATGLAHSATRAVVHRDIKPSNIIISASGRAKLVDMGLARSLDRAGDGGLTQPGVTLGTFDYISPEQALEPREADVRSDIYSLGCTFYHMVTGQAPVPEGTAAKKLHHHQNVAPTDPRRLNPEITDDVAAVLSRMMAKSPAERYQGAEHLVQHLIQLGHKLGSIPELPDGVLFVDAPLPLPPRFKAVHAALAAALVLLALIAVHGWLSRPAPSVPMLLQSAGSIENTVASASPASSENSPPAREISRKLDAPPQVDREVRSVKDFTAFLANLPDAERPVARVLLGGDLDMTEEERAADTGEVPGLVIQNPGGELTILPVSSERRPTIRLTYNPNLPREGLAGVLTWTALTIKGGHVTIRGVRFEMNATQAQIVMAAIKVQEGGQLTLDNCEFVQINPPDRHQGQLSSVTVENPRGALPRPTEISHCYFGSQQPAWSTGTPPSGQNALTVNGPADLRITDCAFAPHAALFDFQGDGPSGRAELQLQHCSALLGNGVAFQVEEGTACRLDVRHSIFSQPGTLAATGGGAAALVRQSGDTQDIRFEGDDNLYHSLAGFWMKGGAAGEPAVSVAAGYEAFVHGPVKDRVRDNSRVMTATPWADHDPLQWLKRTPPDPSRAFRLDVRLPELRQADDPRTHVVGVENCTWGLAYDSPLPALEETKSELAGGRKIVDPKVERSGNGLYPTLSQAIGEAKPNDTIEIRKDGLVAVDPIRFEKPGLNLTIKPYAESHPILTLGDTSDADAALFHVYDGTLNLERLEFYLRPGNTKFTAQAVVDLVGEGKCSFKDCVATLEDPRGARLALGTLTDSSGVMRTDASSGGSGPRLELERCFVRGEGDLALVRAGRSMDLKVENSLVALGGSFLNVENPAKEAAAAQVIQVQLLHSTAYLAEHLLRLAGKDQKPAVPVHIGPARDCLFASTGGGKALIHLEGAENNETQMKSQFAWDGQHNAYSRFMSMLDQKPRGDDMPMMPFSRDKWQTFTGENDGLFTAVHFADPPAPDALLARLLPANFRLGSEPDQQGYGAAIDQVPAPRVEAGMTVGLAAEK